MSQLLVTLITLSACAVAEYFVLEKIVYHPAAGKPVPGELEALLVWALIPLVAYFATSVLVWRRHISDWRVTSKGLSLCLVGTLLAFIGLAQFGHSTPGFLLLGFCVQIAAVILLVVHVIHHAA